MLPELSISMCTDSFTASPHRESASEVHEGSYVVVIASGYCENFKGERHVHDPQHE